MVDLETAGDMVDLDTVVTGQDTTTDIGMVTTMEYTMDIMDTTILTITTATTEPTITMVQETALHPIVLQLEEVFQSYMKLNMDLEKQGLLFRNRQILSPKFPPAILVLEKTHQQLVLKRLK
jgi:hypothetical protein